MSQRTQRDECPHCGWTPAEQDKLSNDRKNLLDALAEIELALSAGFSEGAFTIAHAAIAKATGAA